MRKVLSLTFAAALLAACGKATPDANPDDAQYKLGYVAGQDDEKVALCDQIRDYKDSMADALKDADICP